MEFERQYIEFWGERGPPPGKEECQIGSAGWTSGVQKVMEEYRMQ